jgi:hypothetical protein
MLSKKLASSITGNISARIPCSTSQNDLSARVAAMSSGC